MVFLTKGQRPRLLFFINYYLIMSLVFFFSVFMGLVLVLPVIQQGVVLVASVFCIVFVIRVIFGLLGLVWYGFSLFLIYVGGLLVMFGYVVAIMPNFLFKGKGYGALFSFGFLFSFVFSNYVFFYEGLSEIASFIYSEGGCIVVVGLGVVLLLTLVCVVKICHFSKGSLRPFSVYV